MNVVNKIVNYCNLDEVQSLLTDGANIEAKDNNKLTSLIYASNMVIQK
jgi:hypothetical protein